MMVAGCGVKKDSLKMKEVNERVKLTEPFTSSTVIRVSNVRVPLRVFKHPGHRRASSCVLRARSKVTNKMSTLCLYMVGFARAVQTEWIL